MKPSVRTQYLLLKLKRPTANKIFYAGRRSRPEGRIYAAQTKKDSHAHVLELP